MRSKRKCGREEGGGGGRRGVVVCVGETSEARSVVFTMTQEEKYGMVDGWGRGEVVQPSQHAKRGITMREKGVFV